SSFLFLIMDQKEIFPINPEWIKKSVAWADQKFPYMAYFDPDSTDYPYGGFDHVLFAGKSAIDLSEIKSLPTRVDAVGVLGYDLKNRFEHLESANPRSEEHTSELQSRENLVCRLLLEKKKNK